MLNAVQPGSYVWPHRHLDPPKAESFIVLRGSLAFFSFSEDGEVRECVRLAADGARFGVDLVPGVFHAFIALEPDTLIYEVKTGPDTQATDKEFACSHRRGQPGAARLHARATRGVPAQARAALARPRWREPAPASVARRAAAAARLRAERCARYLCILQLSRDHAVHVLRRAPRFGEAHDFLNSWVADAYRKGELKYAVCLADEPERIIGGIDLRVDPNQHRTMELGYILAREHWGRGYMPEAARKLIEHAFATTDVQRIEAPIFPNTRSRRAAEKMSLSLDGVLRSSRAARGQCWDVADSTRSTQRLSRQEQRAPALGAARTAKPPKTPRKSPSSGVPRPSPWRLLAV